LSLIQVRISHSKHHTAELALKDMRDQVATFQAEIKAIRGEEKIEGKGFISHTAS